MAISRVDLEKNLNGLLQPHLFKDYCPNGLQVEGRDSIQKIVTGVTACQALLDAAIETEADAIFVHHGYFWKNESPCVTGMKRRRLNTLLSHDLNLFAYHLPLDCHPEYGNNVQLAKRLSLEVKGGLTHVDMQKSVGLHGELVESLQASEFDQRIEQALQRKPLHISGSKEKISTVAWCTGGGQSYIENAIELGVDAYISGEISEQTVHLARENGIHYFAAGHHATERYGAWAVGEYLRDHFSLDVEFIDVNNPV